MMNGHFYFGALRFAVTLGAFVLAALVGFIWFIWSEIAREMSFRRQYGEEWQVEYEKYFGPVSSAHGKIAVAVVGIAVLIALMAWIWRLARQDSSRGGRSKRQVAGRASSSERIVRYRRNALLGNYFGLGGIVGGVVLVLFDWGLSMSEQATLAIYVFLAGYLGVVSGCWWWLKAKCWNEAVVLIAFLPLLIFCVPFVRLIYLASPLILPVGMIMMPVILVVVVAVLPDKSGAPRRRFSWKRIGKRRDH